MSKIARWLALLVVSAGVVVAPAGAKEACGTFTPRAPKESWAVFPERAKVAEVIRLTEAATKQHPVEVELEHGVSMWDPVLYVPLKDDPQYVNFQLATGRPSARLHLRMDWSPTSVSEIDMNLFTADGAWTAGTWAPNAVPIWSARSQNGGMGFEWLRDVKVWRCEGLTFESLAYQTLGEKVVLKAWLTRGDGR